jgi:hypothetical protein
MMTAVVWPLCCPVVVVVVVVVAAVAVVNCCRHVCVCVCVCVCPQPHFTPTQVTTGNAQGTEGMHDTKGQLTRY